MVNKITSEKAVKYVKSNKKKIIEKYASLNDYPSSDNPEAIFMAGCPGVGKTEYAESFKKLLESRHSNKHIIRIDADEIKEDIPGYNGSNSEDYHGASSLGVQKILDKVFHRKQDFILDGRFSEEKYTYQNIERAIRHGFQVAIFYIYQDPMIAWKFTKKREVLFGRVVPKSIFVDGLFDSIKCTDMVKEKFGDKVELHIVIKDIKNTGVKKSYFNKDKVANHIKLTYNRNTLFKELV